MATAVRYKEKPIPLARGIVCERCGDTFYTRKAGQGKTKYCGDCKVLIHIDLSMTEYKNSGPRSMCLSPQSRGSLLANLGGNTPRETNECVILLSLTKKKLKQELLF